MADPVTLTAAATTGVGLFKAVQERRSARDAYESAGLQIQQERTEARRLRSEQFQQTRAAVQVVEAERGGGGGGSVSPNVAAFLSNIAGDTADDLTSIDRMAAARMGNAVAEFRNRSPNLGIVAISTGLQGFQTGFSIGGGLKQLDFLDRQIASFNTG